MSICTSEIRLADMIVCSYIVEVAWRLSTIIDKKLLIFMKYSSPV